MSKWRKRKEKTCSNGIRLKGPMLLSACAYVCVCVYTKNAWMNEISTRITFTHHTQTHVHMPHIDNDIICIYGIEWTQWYSNNNDNMRGKIYRIDHTTLMALEDTALQLTHKKFWLYIDNFSCMFLAVFFFASCVSLLLLLSLLLFAVVNGC